ncbi:CDP-diacylglycerol--glycerol-3-phosphate 3-phosphatidyltransferase [Enemella evansiae]|uniref:Phosphatidylinositol phosphate synthase n=1 Tax=Enemella evansiae TaxID=2016499 RepID=A0A255G3K5_9ACTN|nr:CDP-alcohol phosphatidyltransferase family protein [Enemella evansiae]OYO10517.1 CDP-diacylglycerol--glycerol-3-phosphate 3-phosphatidyltransferase [Enemella evansiae]
MLERFRGVQAVVMKPLARALLRAGIGPDAVTWFGTVSVAVVALVCFPLGWLWQGAVLVAVFSCTDMIDGHMAREVGRPSRWGSFLDSTLDRFSDAALFGGIAVYLLLSHAWWGWLAAALLGLVTAQATSYVKARAEAVDCHADAGPLTRADRVALLVLGTLLAGLGVPHALEVMLVALAAGGLLTVVRRMREVRRQLVGPGEPRRIGRGWRQRSRARL